MRRQHEIEMEFTLSVIESSTTKQAAAGEQDAS